MTTEASSPLSALIASIATNHNMYAKRSSFSGIAREGGYSEQTFHLSTSAPTPTEPAWRNHQLSFRIIVNTNSFECEVESKIIDKNIICFDGNNNAANFKALHTILETIKALSSSEVINAAVEAVKEEIGQATAIATLSENTLNSTMHRINRDEAKLLLEKYIAAVKQKRKDREERNFYASYVDFNFSSIDSLGRVWAHPVQVNFANRVSLLLDGCRISEAELLSQLDGSWIKKTEYELLTK